MIDARNIEVIEDEVAAALRLMGADMDLGYIARWADAKDLSDVWVAVLSRCKPR